MVFFKGWFKNTLPSATINKLALLRLGGGMHESTMDAWVNLYHKVSKGGYAIVDDWGAVRDVNKQFLILEKKTK